MILLPFLLLLHSSATAAELQSSSSSTVTPERAGECLTQAATGLVSAVQQAQGTTANATRAALQAYAQCLQVQLVTKVSMLGFDDVVGVVQASALVMDFRMALGSTHCGSQLPCGHQISCL
jgi:hypothetical protein